MTSEILKKSLEEIIEGDVVFDDAVRKIASRDASIFEIMPTCVVYPKHEKDISALVRFVSENKIENPELSLTVRSAGTCMSGGAINNSIIIDVTKYMYGTLSVEKIDDGGIARVLPGTYYRDFDIETKKLGLVMPTYSASRDICTVGGMVGNNAGGEKSLVYGKTENFVTSLRVVFDDGNVYEMKPLTLSELKGKVSGAGREGNIYSALFELISTNYEEIISAKPKVSKNSAGYYLWNVYDKSAGTFDLCALIVGSQGTLGIITEITFRLVQPKKYSRLIVLFLRDLDILPDLVNKILKTRPESMECYDDKTFLIVLRYIYSFAKLLGIKNFFRLIFSFGPETLMTLRYGFPHLIMLVEYTGDSEGALNAQALEATKTLEDFRKIGIHLTKSEFEARKYWTIRHQAFNLIRYHLKKKKSEPFIDDVIVTPDKLSVFYPALYKILDEHKDKMTFAVGGHSGDGNMHIYTLLDPKESTNMEIILSVSDKVYNLVAELGGSITAEHNDGIIRTPYLEKMFSPTILSYFSQTKEIFDPKHIFNPRKKVGGTKEDIKRYFIKE